MGHRFGLIHSEKAFGLRELTSKSSENPQVPTEINVIPSGVTRLVVSGGCKIN